MNRIKRDIKNVLQDKQRKSLPKIAYELIKCSLRDKEIPLHYFNCLLYKKENKNVDNYVSNNTMQRIIKEVFYADGKENENLDNKLLFAEKLTSNGINTPKTFLYNGKHEFIVDGTKTNVSNLDDFIEINRMVTKKMKIKTVFIKPIDGIGGADSFKLDSSDFNNIDTMSTVFETVTQAGFLFQESIIQHSEINKIYPNSINTLRIHTYKDADGKSKIASALMRFGMGGSVVDNGSAGGFYIPINTENWTLKGKGRSYFRSGGVMYENHPDTNFKLDGFEIPFANEVENTTLRVASLFPENIVGWDIAITENGPMVIEGNHNPHIVMAQAACGGFKNHPHFSKVFKNYI